MAGDGVLGFHFGVMGEVPAHINKAIQQMASVLDDLERAAAPIIQTWEGDAKEAYMTRQKLWRDAQNDLTLLLARIRTEVERAHGDYHATEMRNAGMFGG